MAATEKFPLVMSPAMKDALGKYATQHNCSMMHIVRVATAKAIGYDLSKDNIGNSVRGKYATAEERYAAQKARQQEQRHLAKKLIAEYKQQQQKNSIAAMERSIAKK